MITMQDLARGVGASTTAPQRRWVALLMFGLITSLLMAACGGGSSNAPAGGQDAAPGTEEFGLSRQGLAEAIEGVESHIAE